MALIRIPQFITSVVVNGTTYQAPNGLFSVSATADINEMLKMGGILDAGTASTPEWVMNADGTIAGLLAPDGTTKIYETAVAAGGAYGGIYVYDGSTAQTVAAGSTPILMTCFNTAAGANGLSNGMTPAKASNKITVTYAGTYHIAYMVSFTSGTNNSVWEFYAFNDGTRQTSTGAMSKIAVGADVQCVSGQGFATVAAGKDIDLRCYHGEVGSATITPSHANLTVKYVGA